MKDIFNTALFMFHTVPSKNVIFLGSIALCLYFRGVREQRKKANRRVNLGPKKILIVENGIIARAKIVNDHMEALKFASVAVVSPM